MHIPPFRLFRHMSQPHAPSPPARPHASTATTLRDRVIHSVLAIMATATLLEAPLALRWLALAATASLVGFATP
jgi:hypothetical protein